MLFNRGTQAPSLLDVITFFTAPIYNPLRGVNICGRKESVDFGYTLRGVLSPATGAHYVAGT